MRTGELKEGGVNFLLQFPFKVPDSESSDINRNFGHWMIYLKDPIAASPNWWEVIRGYSETARIWPCPSDKGVTAQTSGWFSSTSWCYFTADI